MVVSFPYDTPECLLRRKDLEMTVAKIRELTPASARDPNFEMFFCKALVVELALMGGKKKVRLCRRKQEG